MVASIDQVVVNDNHAEANVTSFMAFDPSTRSTRSFDLEFRDEQWKICQAPVANGFVRSDRAHRGCGCTNAGASWR